jgi:hypothetical protein
LQKHCESIEMAGNEGRVMALLRFIDPDGIETDVADLEALYDLIQAGRMDYERLVRDEASGRWVKAADHPFFKRIREIAGQQEPLAPPPLQASNASAGASPVTNDLARAAGEGKPKPRWLLVSVAAGVAMLVIAVGLIVTVTDAAKVPQRASAPQSPALVPNNDWLKNIPELVRR